MKTGFTADAPVGLKPNCKPLLRGEGLYPSLFASSIIYLCHRRTGVRQRSATPAHIAAEMPALPQPVGDARGRG
ncbi:hypothetical protein [Kamptonema formosum]|uniref:hypothetical protein n=1 Tax=Kamptonema formosum TaxID=331992 RepID=UPI0012DC639F|nr:hypothetical protein [Oscillatoria sp. PCC 10802]